MAGFVASFHQTPLPEQLDQPKEKESGPDKPRKPNSEKETRSRAGSIRNMFNFFGHSQGQKSPPPKQKQKSTKTSGTVTTQPKPSNTPELHKAFDLSDNNQSQYEGWVYPHTDEVIPDIDFRPDHGMVDPGGTSEVGTHQEETDYFKGKHHKGSGVSRDATRSPQSRKRGKDLTENERQLMEAIDERTMEKSQLQEKLSKANQEILVLRDQVRQLVTESEERKRSKEGSGDHQSAGSENDLLKQRVRELESELTKRKEHSKSQSRKVMKLKEEAVGAEMQEETIQSYEGIIQDLEKREEKLQKDLRSTRSELETVTKYKELTERELIAIKEEAFRAKTENEDLRDQMQRLSKSIEGQNNLKRENHKLSNENKMLKDQLETTKAQVVVFESEFTDERRDREAAHSKLADLEKKLAQQEGLYTEEKAEYNRQLAIAHQEVETTRKELQHANKMLQKQNKTTLSKKQNTSEADDVDFWRNQVVTLKHKIEETSKYVSELEEFRSRITDLEKDCQDKHNQVEQLRKELEKKNKDLDKMTKKVNKLEEEAKKKKKKKKDSGATVPEVPPPQESVEAQKRARTELLYNDASVELQELHKELRKWQGRYQQLQNENSELKRQVEVMQVSFKEQDKQIQKIATTPDDPSLVNHQLQISDTQTGDITNDVPALRNIPNLPLRATATAMFDADVVTDSASPRQTSKGPLRAVDPNVQSDNLPSPNPSGPTNEPFPSQGTPLPHVSADTVPAATNYHQGQPLTVADQMQRFGSVMQPCGQVNPGTVLPPQVRTAPPGPVGPHGMNDYVNINQFHQPQQPFQPQPGYAPGQQMVSDSQYPAQQGSGENEFEALFQKQRLEREQQKQYQLHHQQVKEEEYQFQQQETQARELRIAQLRQQQAQAQAYQQPVQGQLQQQPVQGQAQGYQQKYVQGQVVTYENTGISQHNFPPSQAPFNQAPPDQQYNHQGGATDPNNLQYQPNPVHVADTDGFNSAGTPSETPEEGNFVQPQESSNGSDQATDSLVGGQKLSVGAAPRPHSDDVSSNRLNEETVQPKSKSTPFQSSSNDETFQETPPQEVLTPSEEAPPNQTNPSLPPDVDPSESLGDQRFANVLQDSIDTDISQHAAEVMEQVSSRREREVTNTDRPFDPNLVCPICNRAFRIGEIQKFRAHVNQCEGKKN